jgi:hypothetical protein
MVDSREKCGIQKLRRKKTSMEERRKRERVSVQFDVGVILNGECIQVQILNISLTGILCTNHPHFQKGAACKVKISFSDDLQITIDAKILRVGDQGAAISFVEMDEESFVHLMWCSSMRVTQATAKESTSTSSTEPATGRYPSESDKSVMLRAFGIPPDKCR